MEELWPLRDIAELEGVCLIVQMIKKAILAMFAISAVVNASTLDVGLLAHYTFDGNANDISSNARNLVLRDSTQTSYVYSPYFNKQVLNISGNNRADYFTAPDPYVSGIPFLNENQISNYSYAMWINPSSFGRGFPEWTYLIESASGSGLRYGENASQNNLGFGYPSLPFSANQWQHIAGTKDGQIWKFYFNGVYVGGGDPGITYFDKNNYFLFNSGGYQYQFNGQVSDTVIYDRALSSAEVAALIPEPSAISLLAVGLGGLAVMRRRRRS